MSTLVSPSKSSSIVIPSSTLVNTHLFSEAANYKLKNGVYCEAPYGSKDYREFWGEQDRRCLEGYSVGGVRITGRHYFFLNFKQLESVKDIKAVASQKERTFPRFWEAHYKFFHALELAEIAGKHFCILKPRGTGFSELMSCNAVRDYTLIKGSKSFFFASNEGFLNKDGVITKCWDHLELLNAETEKAYRHLRQVKNQDLHKRASQIDPKTGNEYGYKSEIIARVIDHPRKVRGARTGSYGKVYFEEGGSFPNLKEAVMATRPLVEQGGVSTGQIVIWGTGGETGPGIEGLEHIFYHPDAYNMMSFDNEWEDDRVGTKSCWFLPVYAAMDKYMDADGNADIEGAKQHHLQERERIHKEDPRGEDKYIAEYPFCVHPDTWVSGIDWGMARVKDIPGRYDNGIQDRYRLITSLGKEIICTENHKFLVNGDYRHLKDLNSGDKLEFLPVTFNVQPQFVKIKVLNGVCCDLEITPDWARFIGLFMGDGSLYKNQLSCVFDQQDISTLNWYVDFCIKNLAPPQVRQVSNKGIEVRFTNNNLRDFLSEPLELIKTRTNDKEGIKRKVHVPDYIIKSSREVVKAFLQGVFDSDGCIYSKQRRITIYSKHRKFLQDIQMLLSGFGINARIRQQQKINSSGYVYTGQTLELTAKEVEVFKREIRFISDRKNQTLDAHSTTLKLNKQSIPEVVESITYYDKGQVYDVTTGDGYYSIAGVNSHNTPGEALTRLSQNIFPIAELQRQLLRVQTDKSIKGFLKHGWMLKDTYGRAKFTLDSTAREITEFPHQNDGDLKGCVTIVESPYKDQMGKVPAGTYLIIVDPYYNDQATDKTSLFSAFVYKHINNVSPTEDDMLVAWYVGRPDTLEESYRQLFLLAEYYNATIQSEIQGGGKGIYDYAKQHRLLERCEKEPDILYNKDGHVKDYNKPYFINMSSEDRVKLALAYSADWLKTPRSALDDNGEQITIMNLNKIYCEALLKEYIKFNMEGNFDRVSAIRLLPFMIKERSTRIFKRHREESTKNFWDREFHGEQVNHQEFIMSPADLAADAAAIEAEIAEKYKAFETEVGQKVKPLYTNNWVHPDDF